MKIQEERKASTNLLGNTDQKTGPKTAALRCRANQTERKQQLAKLASKEERTHLKRRHQREEKQTSKQSKLNTLNTLHIVALNWETTKSTEKKTNKSHFTAISRNRRVSREDLFLTNSKFYRIFSREQIVEMRNPHC